MGIPLHVTCGATVLGSLCPHSQMQDNRASSIIPVEADGRLSLYLGDLPPRLGSPTVLPSTSAPSGEVGEPNESLDTALSWLEPLAVSFSQPLRHSMVPPSGVVLM